MRAAWWWVDRWRCSSAYRDMGPAEQGVYRNLLDELWLRDGLLPDDESVLARISCSGALWPSLREKILAHFQRVPGGYRNETHDRVQAESERKARNSRAYRARREAKVAGHLGLLSGRRVTTHVSGDVTDDTTRNGDVTGHVSASLSLSPAEIRSNPADERTGGRVGSARAVGPLASLPPAERPLEVVGNRAHLPVEPTPTDAQEAHRQRVIAQIRGAKNA